MATPITPIKIILVTVWWSFGLGFCDVLFSFFPPGAYPLGFDKKKKTQKTS